MLLNGMFAFRKTIVQIKRNPDTSTESIADQQPSTYPQHLYKYVSLTTAVQISRLFDILMSHRLYFPRYTELNDPLETSLDKGTQRKTTENELPSLTQCTA